MIELFRLPNQSMDLAKANEDEYHLWACEENAPTPSLIRMSRNETRALYEALRKEFEGS